MTQQAQDMFAARKREEDARATAVGSNAMFIPVVDSADADTPFTRRNQYRRGPDTADSSLRNDNIVSALKEGTAEVKNSDGIHVGWENTRVDLLIDSERRKLLDVLPYSPSREETLANIIRRECHGMTEDQQYALACLDKNIDRDVIRPMLMESAYRKQSVEQEVPRVEPAPEARPAPQNIEEDVRNVIVAKQASAPVQPQMPQAPVMPQNPCPLPATPAFMTPQSPCPMPAGPMPAQTGLNIPFNQPSPQAVRLSSERLVSLTCPIGRYNIPVLDIIQEAQYIVIVQKEDAYLLVSFDPNHVTYRIDAVQRDLEYSGISFRFNGCVFTVMITK